MTTESKQDGLQASYQASERGWSRELRGAAIGIVGALIGALPASVASYYATRSASDAKLVEIGVSILAADPKTDVAPARQWAIDLVETHAGQRFSDRDRDTLLHNPIGTTCRQPGTMDFSTPCNSALIP